MQPPVSELVLYWRRRMDWTQLELADHTGVDKSTVSLWESGGMFPSHANLCRLVKALKIDLARFYAARPRRLRGV